VRHFAACLVDNNLKLKIAWFIVKAIPMLLLLLLQSRRTATDIATRIRFRFCLHE